MEAFYTSPHRSTTGEAHLDKQICCQPAQYDDVKPRADKRLTKVHALLNASTSHYQFPMSTERIEERYPAKRLFRLIDASLATRYDSMEEEMVTRS